MKTFGMDDAHDINCGHCYNWAWLAVHLIPEATLEYYWNHAWICIGNKFYDSEHLIGVDSAFEFDLLEDDCVQEDDIHENVPLDEFIEFWRVHGNNRGNGIIADPNNELLPILRKIQEKL